MIAGYELKRQVIDHLAALEREKRASHERRRDSPRGEPFVI
jgi:hypothetical protein